MFNFPWLKSPLGLLIVIGLVGGLVLGLIDRLIQIYGFIAVYQPTIAGLVVILLLALIIGLIVAGWRYFHLFQQQKSKDKLVPQVSTDKVEAVEENLYALQQQVAQIQDEVLRRSLQGRSEELWTGLEQQELKVVIFGTGSAGKTSLVNALLGAQIELGAVSAAMGTTQVGEVYAPVQISGLSCYLEVTDTPGILEVGGTEREQLAKEIATEADLLLFVVDNDLLKSEYDLLQALASIGKRSLLVFNKTDLYAKSDRQIILDRLRQRVSGFMFPEDVVAIAANPKTLRLDSGEIISPNPKLQPLLRRLVNILNQEGDELVADNILLRSQRLGDETRDHISQQRQQAAEKVIEKFQWLVVGVIFATPLPVVDLLATAAINAQMVVEIAKIYDCELNLERGRELASSLARTLASLGIVKGITQIVTTAISVTIVGYLLKSTIQGITGAYLTRIAGKSFVEYFSANQNWGDGGITEVVQRQFELNRRDEFIKSFIQDAVQRLGGKIN